MTIPVKYALFTTAWLILLLSCHQSSTTAPVANAKKANGTFYSKIVGDSFNISVRLPNDYDTGAKIYPVVYLLDANFYFDMIASTVSTYQELGFPPVILVGIGYKDLMTMDSLRNRDYTFPVALPEYEMSASGGAGLFLDFMKKELLPSIDSNYRTDTTNRILMGHSLGGYLVSYALLQNLSGNFSCINNFVAASPSLNYNNYYLLDQFKKLNPPGAGRPVSVFMTYGGLEDEEEADDPPAYKVNALSKQLTDLFSAKFSGRTRFRSEVYSNLGHMEAAYPGLMKGLSWVIEK